MHNLTAEILVSYCTADMFFTITNWQLENQIQHSSPHPSSIVFTFHNFNQQEHTIFI